MAPSTSLRLPSLSSSRSPATLRGSSISCHVATLLVGFCVSRFARLSASSGSLYSYAADTLPRDSARRRVGPAPGVRRYRRIGRRRSTLLRNILWRSIPATAWTSLPPVRTLAVSVASPHMLPIGT